MRPPPRSPVRRIKEGRTEAVGSPHLIRDTADPVLTWEHVRCALYRYRAVKRAPPAGRHVRFFEQQPVAVGCSRPAAEPARQSPGAPRARHREPESSRRGAAETRPRKRRLMRAFSRSSAGLLGASVIRSRADRSRGTQPRGQEPHRACQSPAWRAAGARMRAAICYCATPPGSGLGSSCLVEPSLGRRGRGLIPPPTSARSRRQRL
jgi:hypothetical protein